MEVMRVTTLIRSLLVSNHKLSLPFYVPTLGLFDRRLEVLNINCIPGSRAEKGFQFRS